MAKIPFLSFQFSCVPSFNPHSKCLVWDWLHLLFCHNSHVRRGILGGGILTKDVLNGGELGYPQQMMMSIMNSLLDSFRQHWSENWPIQGNQLRGEGILQWPVSPNLLPNSSAGWKKVEFKHFDISKGKMCNLWNTPDLGGRVDQ